MNTTQNIQATQNPTLMAQVLHNANLASLEKAFVEPTKSFGAPSAVLVRKDVQNRVVAFLPDTYDKAENKISYWSGEKGAAITETNADYYFTSKAAEDGEVKDIVAKYSARFHMKEIVIRKRLYKESVMRTPSSEKEGDVQASQKEFVDKIIAAMQKAAYKAIGIEV